ncbi:MAG: UvrD-helicase domain-containing protein [Bacteroidales bacterium]|nr:UvrD-helicase domain-containing protein [Bacteroidales bacterium]
MPLVVYKSSAGSGKTTTLVNEYLKICLQRPEDFRHILAITFTNKAAHEMKDRIIGTLKIIAKNQWHSDSAIQLLFDKVNLSEIEFADRAKKVLTLILHRYEDFSVSTIDSFIHKVIRTFSNEVNLPPNFEVVLNHQDMIPEIVQRLYDKVGTDANLTEILVRFVLTQTEDEKSPDPTYMLNSFIVSQMSEESFLQVKKLADLSSHQLWIVIKKLLNNLENQKVSIEKVAVEALKLINDHGIVSGDLAGGTRGIYSFFSKAAQVKNTAVDKLPATATVLKYIAEDKWTSSKVRPDVKKEIELIKTQLLDHFEHLVHLFEPYFMLYLLSRKIYTLALIHELRLVMDGYTEETGKVHISDFNKLVYNQVAGQPVPFIYERLGKKYQYFLIDEFQDTSLLQWNNLLPLIDESLAYNRFNMLVGDAKQAIYRFRNGEVELFANLPMLFENDGSAISLQRENQLINAYQEIPLDTNWRSHEEIIRFNNRFFGFLKNQSGEYIEKIYSIHEQKVSGNKTGGLVSLHLINDANKEDLWLRKQEKIREIVEQLLENGYQLNDIGILCRTGEAVRLHAAFLMNLGYPVLSEESLLVANAPEVQVMAAFFQLLANPSDSIAQTTLAENLRLLHHAEKETDAFLRILISLKCNTLDCIFDYFNIQKGDYNLAQKPLTEIADFVCRNLLKTSKANVFVQYYFELLHQAPQSIEDLNRLWEDKKKSYFIASPENTDAIQVMTVHKSKGLAFNTVIVDADQDMIKATKREFWMDMPSDDPDELQVGLLPLSRALSLINKEEIFLREQNRSLLDYLNVLYVAFTRPRKALFILANNHDEIKRGKLATYLFDFLNSEGLFEAGLFSYQFGELPTQSIPVTVDVGSEQLSSWVSYPWNDERWVTKPDESLFFDEVTASGRDYGIMLHRLLSCITDYRDIDYLMEHQLLSGVFTEEESTFLTSILVQLTRHPKLSAYFMPGVWSRNETEVLLNSGEIIRPDRIVKTGDSIVVIDYKTGERKPEHTKQIQDYKQAMIQLGYTNVKALLVYLQDEIEVAEVF